jgi:hypothetical protein
MLEPQESIAIDHVFRFRQSRRRRRLIATIQVE